MAREKHKRRKSRGESTEAEHWDGPIRISDEGPVMGTGAKGSGSGGRVVETTGNRKMQIHTTGKPFNVTKKQVYEAYKAVKSNAGSAGVDGQTIEQFGSDLRRNLYKLWNRMSSGSYLSTAGARRLHSQKDWRPADFRCAYRSGSCGPDGC